ncbi:CpaF family protein [Paenibacillus piri]|uniref:CpaF family protein n=1 Tax=Paenibacillus piri TaxID=2547395 RepID=A0A4R5KWN0_9BACL|nr:CpaF family protein [Paenibacillus piri]TDF99588.1 CpaF family protein [Paenibacillus piri]
MWSDETVAILKQIVKEKLDLSFSVTDEQLMEMIEQEVFAFPFEDYLTFGQKHRLVLRLFHSFRGLDVLQPLVDDASITEIMINRHDQIFIEQDGRVALSDVKFESREKLEDVIQSIVARVNRAVNESSPIVDARLLDGSRVNVVLSPVALEGPAMTIRKFPSSPLTLADLIAKGALTDEAAAFLIRLVKAKYNLFIGGGTGSGKTTFLNALSQYIPDDERIITIEDSAELQIRTVPNLVRLETRNVNTEGKGEITIRDLIRSSLRMRPNRIIVGEVRGAEALDMLQAMNTGHDGSLSTGHANSTTDMLSRLETMVLSGASLPVEVIRKQICSAIDVMIHLQRLRDRSRRITEISEIIGLSDGEVQLNPLFQFVERGEAPEGSVIGELQSTGNALRFAEKLAMAGVTPH